MLIDRLGHICKKISPDRIISLVPSWSEFIFDLGAEERLVGRTKYCVEPKSIQSIPTVGGTKNPDIGQIAELEPDLVIINKEENKVQDINSMRALGFNLLITGAITIPEALEEMALIEFVITHRTNRTRQIASIIAEHSQENSSSYSFIYLVWLDPLMVASHSTYISRLISLAGGQNLIGNQWNDRYPQLDIDTLISLNPNYLFLPDEPYKFNQKHIEYFTDMGYTGTIVTLDGKLASWYGTRLKDAISYFHQVGK